MNIQCPCCNASLSLSLVANSIPDPAPIPNEVSSKWHRCRASSFADPADVEAFKRAKARGLPDREAFAYGDNGEGCWGDDTTQAKAMVALPPDTMVERWGSVKAARHKAVVVRLVGEGKGKPVEGSWGDVMCVLADRMPHRTNIKNGRGIDLNPEACKQLGISIPADAEVEWAWA